MSSEVACSITETRQKNMESHQAQEKAVPSEMGDPVIEMVMGNKMNNKENTKPTNGLHMSVSKKVQKKNATGSSAPLRSKNDKNVENLGDLGVLRTKPKTQSMKTQLSGKGDGAKKRRTLSQAFLSQHAVQQRKLVVEVAKPPTSVPPKLHPGTYKGRVIQSKVNSFRKPTGGSGEVEPTAALTKPPVPEGCKKAQSVVGIRGKTSAALPKKSFAPSKSRFKSESIDALASAAKTAPNATAFRENGSRTRLYPASCQLAKTRVVVPPARLTSEPKSTARPGSSKSTVTMKKEMQVSKSKAKLVAAAATDKKAPKPPVTSTASKYRVTMETAEERKAKLAEWLASKGKTLKRPPIASAMPQTTSRPPPSKALPKPRVVTEARHSSETEPAAQQDSDLEIHPIKHPESSPEVDVKPETGHKEVPENATFSSADIMNTTLDLLENSEMDLPVDPEIRMDDVVVNLCSAMEAMQGPSSCENDAQAQRNDEGRILEKGNQMKTLAEMSEEEVDLENQTDGIAEAKDGEAERTNSVKKGVKMECADETEGDEERQSESAPEGASVVKYSVKTTPYLQSVKQRIQSEAATPGSGGRRRSGIKDLKFLTPVRRSVRIQRGSSRLPDALTEHDPCVSSLAELVHLDDDANAYIYRKNPTLLQELPDQPQDLERF